MGQIRILSDIEEIERVPLAQRQLPKSTYAMIRRSALTFPDHSALVFFPDGEHYQASLQVTYRQLLGRIHQVANMLADLGVGLTDVVSLLLPNLPQTHFALWGAEAAGIVNPVNPLLEASQIATILRAARTKVLIALGPLPNSDIWEKVVTIRPQVPSLTTVIQVLGEPSPEKEWVPFETQLEQYPADRLLSGRIIAPDELAAYFHTGGTTGSPKLARHTHANEVFDAWAITQVADSRPEDVMLCGLPLFHVNAVHVTGLAPLSIGASIVLLGPAGYRDPGVIKHFWKIVEQYQATSFSGVPTLYTNLLRVPIDADIHSLKTAVCGAAPMPIDVYTTFEQHTGVRILEGYGLTEATCASSTNPRYGERRVGSIGLRYPYQAMKTVVLDQHGRYLRDCLPNETGALVVKGPNVFAGYVQEEQNTGLWVADGWLNTGDLGRQDEDGYFWLSGRAKDLIIRGGHNLDPAVIEEALYSHPAVALAAAVGKPDAYAGELPVAYVVLKAGATATEQALLDHAYQTVKERAAIPKSIVILDQMPVTAVGKIFKPPLRCDAVRRVYAEDLSAVLPAHLSLEIQIEPNHQYGMLATLILSGVPEEQRAHLHEQIARALGAYVVKYQIQWR
ncbi:acyl-CoA synthetase [Ktedonobacter robiniae]|uniref:Acyl-CoA synthetase n=1 Tax=Ktedonobacter robiniae TaxID=2778365 RepID=A0ABQ3V237_9CHLR|nr:acyl-CoA synthetase [Ktedonobacter robiniae]GHO58647.1 acyl-CoA synthetase [Ktedonobacter robiniae]